MKIEFTQEVKIGDKSVTDITVRPLTFIELGRIWDDLAKVGSKTTTQATSMLQRERMRRQARFMAGPETLIPEESDISRLPIKVAKQIIEALDEGQGEAGKVIGEGDGISTPIIYQLGTPVAMKSSKGEEVKISELEFQATTFADIEDVLAADHDVNKTLALLKLAKPLGSSLSQLPGWAMDRLTVADGVTMMTKILPNF